MEGGGRRANETDGRQEDETTDETFTETGPSSRQQVSRPADVECFRPVGFGLSRIYPIWCPGVCPRTTFLFTSCI